MAAPATDWKHDRALNEHTHLVAVPGIYRFTIANGNKASLKFANLLRSAQVYADGAVLVGLTAAGVDGTTNRITCDSSRPLSLEGQTPSLWFKNSSGANRVVEVIVSISDSIVATAFGELTSANGFDGGDASVALTNPEA